jgi:hypothetical protein
MGKLTDVDKIFDCLKSGNDLPADLQMRYDRLTYARELLYGMEIQSITEIAKAISVKFSVSESMGRLDVLEAKRLFPFLDPVERDFEKSWVVHSIKMNIDAARKKGDLKTVAAENKNLMNIYGFDKDLGEPQSPSLIINVLNFNPELIGAKALPSTELDRQIDEMLAEDVKKELEFDDIDWEDLKDE